MIENKDWPNVRRRKTKVKGREYFNRVVDCGVIDGKRKVMCVNKARKQADILRKTVEEFS